MSDACTKISIDGHDPVAFTRPRDADPVEFEGVGPVTGDPHQDLAHLFEDAWEHGPTGGPSVGMGGWSRHEQVGLHAYARGYTALVLGSTATVTLEWYGDGGPFREVSLYRDGTHVGGTHTEDVPDALPGTSPCRPRGDRRQPARRGGRLERHRVRGRSGAAGRRRSPRRHPRPARRGRLTPGGAAGPRDGRPGRSPARAPRLFGPARTRPGGGEWSRCAALCFAPSAPFSAHEPIPASPCVKPSARRTSRRAARL